MNFDILGQSESLFVDYSIIAECAGKSVFSDFVSFINSSNHKIYVAKSFKLFHYCVLHQSDDRNMVFSNAMRFFCSSILNEHRLSEIGTAKTEEIVKSVSQLSLPCIITTAKSILIKRIREKNLDFGGRIGILGVDGFVLYDSLEDFFKSNPVPDISPLAARTEFLDSSVFCNVGDVVYTGNGMPLTLDERLSAGAEGMVFTTNNPSLVAKIYHKGMITPMRWRKLMRMVEMGVKSVGICWPRDLIFYKDVPVGYTMMKGKGKTLGNVFDGPDAMMDNFPDWTRSDIVDTLINVLEKYIFLHMYDIIAGDIQLKNALLFSPSAVFLIDMDSIQIGNMPCPVGTEEFTDPTLWGKNFSSFLRKLENEDYSMAMLVFSMLFCGLHPYATRNGQETLNAEIESKAFPYTLDDSDVEHIPKGGYQYIWEYLPVYLRTMLYSTFKLGKRYEAIDWYDAVLRYKKELVERSFTDEEAYKVFPKMNYHRTVNASVAAPVKDFNNGKPGFAKKTFQQSIIYPAGFENSNSSSDVASFKRPPPPTRSGSQNSDTNKASANNKNDTNKSGLFGGLFGKR